MQDFVTWVNGSKVRDLNRPAAMMVAQEVDRYAEEALWPTKTPSSKPSTTTSAC